ncbi:hypothetical protein RSAG8_09307, partial [Rhizoctonia solani AG-8 WAC10335]
MLRRRSACGLGSVDCAITSYASFMVGLPGITRWRYLSRSKSRPGP